MTDFSDRLDGLVRKVMARGAKAYEIAKEAEITPGALSQFRSGDRTPKAATIERLADGELNQ